MRRPDLRRCHAPAPTPQRTPRLTPTPPLPPASLGAPTNTLAASETITGATDRGSRTYRLLDIKHLLAAKLAAFAARGSSNDFDDLLWLLNSQYNAEIRGLSGTMPLEQRRALMAAAERKKPRIPAPRLRRYRHLLRLA